MSTTTSIQWTDATWNPTTGCSRVSEGCRHCYIERTPPFRMHGRTLGDPVQLHHERLDAPLHWKKPRRVFVNSLSDLFHEDVPFDFVHEVFATIRRTTQHTYQILTKRPERMREFINEHLRPHEPTGWDNILYRHVWFGVSVEDQASADERIPILLQTPAAVRWISAEPLLDRVDLWRHLAGICHGGCTSSEERCDHYRRTGSIACCPECYHRSINWAVIGGESGPGARPCDLAWIRSIKDQCQAAAVPVFVKQLGALWYDTAARVGIRGSVAVPIDRPWTWVTQRDRKGGDFDDAEFPMDLRVREFPNT